MGDARRGLLGRFLVSVPRDRCGVCSGAVVSGWRVVVRELRRYRVVLELMFDDESGLA